MNVPKKSLIESLISLISNNHIPEVQGGGIAAKGCAKGNHYVVVCIYSSRREPEIDRDN